MFQKEHHVCEKGHPAFKKGIPVCKKGILFCKRGHPKKGILFSRGQVIRRQSCFQEGKPCFQEGEILLSRRNPNCRIVQRVPGLVLAWPGLVIAWRGLVIAQLRNCGRIQGYHSLRRHLKLIIFAHRFWLRKNQGAYSLLGFLMDTLRLYHTTIWRWSREDK